LQARLLASESVMVTSVLALSGTAGCIIRSSASGRSSVVDDVACAAVGTGKKPETNMRRFVRSGI
jgi:hypothetical protein